MLQFILGFVVCWAIAWAIQEFDDRPLPGREFYAPMYVVAIAVAAIPAILYHMFFHVMRPCTFEQLVKVKATNPSHWHDYGYWGWCYDPTAEYWFQRFFFYRIKKG